MNTDSFFTIGSTHRVCEDYCASLMIPHGKNAGPFIALSDGCSSSQDTDFGSRLLVKSVINHYGNMECDPNEDYFLPAIWEWVDANVQAIGSLNPTCLDATLLFAYKNKNNIEVIVIGDGTVAAKAKDGMIYSKTIEYKGNAPLYLSYLYSDQSRRLQREKEFDCTKIVKSKMMRKGNILNDEQVISTNIIEKFTFDVNDYDYVSIFSDGVESFTQPLIETGSKTFQLVPEHQVIEESLSYKNNGGEFVRRRCQRFVPEWKQQQMVNTDDFSIATIFTGE